MKKMISFVLAIALVAASGITVFAHGYEETEAATEASDFPFAAGGGVQFIGDWDREFDSPIEQFLFMRFGEGFEHAKRNLTDINKTFAAGDFEIEILSAMALADREFRRPVVQIPQAPRVLEWDPETGEIIWGEQDMLEERAVYTNLVDVFIFGTLKDPGGILGDMREAILDISRERDEPMFLLHSFALANVVHVDSETGAAYFATVLQVSAAPDAEYVNADFTIERMLSDFRRDEWYAGIDFAYILATHEASFVVEPLDEAQVFPDGQPRRSGFVAYEFGRALGDDSHPLSPEAETLARGELSIQVTENMHITNLALRDNLLLVQITEPGFDLEAMEAIPFGFRPLPPIGPPHPAMGATFTELVDTRISRDDIASVVEEMRASFVEWTSAGNEPQDFDDSLYSERLHEFHNRRLHEAYMIDITFGHNEPRITERAFLIEDAGLIDHLDFGISASYFAIDIPLQFSFEGVYVPILNMGRLSFDGVFQVFIQGSYFGLTDLEVSMREISFSVLDPEPLWVDHGANAFDLFEIEYVFADGETIGQRFSTGSWSSPSPRDGENSASYSFSGVFVDIGELVGVRINGTEIRLTH